MHSTYSEDGSSSLEEMCRQAVLGGIPEIGFCEHWDVGPFEKNPFFFRVESWYTEIERLRSLFASRLIIRAGVEVAEPHLYHKEAVDVLRRASFDYVIGSVHWQGSNFMFDEGYFRTHAADEVYEAYFEELEQMVSVSDIDIVAHFDIPARTAIPLLGYDPTRYRVQICKVLGIIINRGFALDINTAGLRKPSCNLMPDRQILQWYKEMGGDRLTLGSDAHSSSQVGLHLDTALQVIRDVGFTHLTHFKKRKMEISPLP